MSSSELPYLGRCKDCDYAVSVLPEQILPGETLRDVRAGEAPKRLGNYGVMGRCPNRHHAFHLSQVKGTYNPNHKCDARCLNAKGDDCSCSCGGANHGRGHVIQVLTIEDRAVNAPATGAVANPVAIPKSKVEKPHKPSWRDEPMSEPQRRKISFMLQERSMAPEKRIEARRQLDQGLTKGKASDWITRLEELPVI